MRRLIPLCVLAVLVLGGVAEAQNIAYWPPQFTGSGSSSVFNAPGSAVGTHGIANWQKIALTAGGNTTYATVSVPVAGFTSIDVQTATFCSDGVNSIVRQDHVLWNCVNLGGTETCSAASPTGAALVTATGGSSFGTYGITYSVAPTNGIALILNVACSLDETILDTYWTAAILSSSVPTIVVPGT